VRRLRKVLLWCGVLLAILVALDITLVNVRTRSFQDERAGGTDTKDGFAQSALYRGREENHSARLEIGQVAATPDAATTETLTAEKPSPTRGSPLPDHRLKSVRTVRPKKDLKTRAVEIAKRADRPFMFVYIGGLRGLEAGVWLLGKELPAGAYTEIGLESLRCDLCKPEVARNYLNIALTKEARPFIRAIISENLAAIDG
jgi:hypothetical protein